MGKWYSLYDKIYRMENLEGAFRQVKRNHGAPGIDGVTIEIFEARLSENLELIHNGTENQNIRTQSCQKSGN